MFTNPQIVRKITQERDDVDQAW